MRGRIEGGGRRGQWDGWMASLTRWTWVWASSRSWWWTGKPDVLQSMGSQRVGHDWATELTLVVEPDPVTDVVQQWPLYWMQERWERSRCPQICGLLQCKGHGFTIYQGKQEKCIRIKEQNKCNLDTTTKWKGNPQEKIFANHISGEKKTLF